MRQLIKLREDSRTQAIKALMVENFSKDSLTLISKNGIEVAFATLIVDISTYQQWILHLGASQYFGKRGHKNDIQDLQSHW